MYPWLPIFSFKPKWGGSRSWCTPGHPSFLNKPTWDSSKSWCALGCPSFPLSLSGVIARVGVPLATHFSLLLLLLIFVVNMSGTVARAGVPLAVHFPFKPKWGSSRSWCTPGHPSFVVVHSSLFAWSFLLHPPW